MATDKAVRRFGPEQPRNARAFPNVSNLSHRALTAKGIEAYGMPMEQLRQKADEESRELNWKERYESEYQPMFAVFAKRHPELRKYSDHNSAQICLALETPEGLGPMNRDGRVEPNKWDLEMAYNRALTKGKLRLDEQIVSQQRIEEYEQRETHPYGLTAQEDEAYSISMDELRRRCTPGSYDPLGPRG